MEIGYLQTHSATISCALCKELLKLQQRSGKSKRCHSALATASSAHAKISCLRVVSLLVSLTRNIIGVAVLEEGREEHVQDLNIICFVNTDTTPGHDVYGSVYGDCLHGTGGHRLVML